MDALKTVSLTDHLGDFYLLVFTSPSWPWLLSAVKEADTGFGSDENAVQLSNLQCPVHISVSVSAILCLHMKGSLLLTHRRSLVKKVVCMQTQVVFSW